jgi:Tfp pilus assembly protein PilN
MSINLLDWREKRWRKELNFFYLLFFLTNCSAFIISITYNAHLNNKLNKVKPAERHLMKESKTLNYEKIKQIKKYRKRNVTILKTLKLISASIPSNCRLSAFSVSKRRVQLKGKALSLNTIVGFLNKLKCSGYLRETQLTTTKNHSNNKLQHFTLTMQYI